MAETCLRNRTLQDLPWDSLGGDPVGITRGIPRWIPPGGPPGGVAWGIPLGVFWGTPGRILLNSDPSAMDLVIYVDLLVVKSAV